jgi:hypothetical protein
VRGREAHRRGGTRERGCDRRMGCDGAAQGAVVPPGVRRCCGPTRPAHPVAGCHTASVAAAPCTTAVTARRGVRQHAKGCDAERRPTRAGAPARRHPGYPTPRTRRAGHHWAPGPTRVPLGRPASCTGRRRVPD